MKNKKTIKKKSVRDILEGRQQTIDQQLEKKNHYPPVLKVKRRRRYNYFERRWEDVLE